MRKRLLRMVCLSFLAAVLSALCFGGSAASAATLPVRSDLNEPANGDTIFGVTAIRGWFLDPDGVNKIEVLIDGKVAATAITGISRPDVIAVYPAYKNASSGYLCMLDTTKLTDGAHKLVIRETSRKNKQNSLAARTVTVANHTALKAIGDLNEPYDGQALSGAMTVRGWFLSGSGIRKVEILIDGNAIGEAQTGFARPDVLAAYPAYKNAESEFRYVLDATTLSGGAHTIAVRQTSADGGATALAPKTIYIAGSSQPEPAGSGKIIAGYYASWAAYSGYTPASIPAGKLTHINYAFANIGSDLKIAMGDSQVDPDNFAKLRALKKTYPSLKTLISVGGWEWSGKFSDVALSDASRTKFANSVVAFIKQHGFDGLDIDWEYPVSGGLASNKYRAADKQNFTLLLKKIREVFDAQGAADGKRYLLTIAGGAGSTYAANVELGKIAQYLDYANLMTYDIHGPWDRYTDFNAPLYSTKAKSPQFVWSADAAVSLWTGKGFPASKLVMGIPFYAYSYTGVPDSGNGLYQTYSKGKSVPYDDLVAKYLSDASYARHYDADAHARWLFNGSTTVVYDDLQSVCEKANYIAANSLGGAMIWELSQNKSGELLDGIYTSLQ